MPWELTGNGIINPFYHFLGTTGPATLVIRTNNAERMRIDGFGNVGIGTGFALTPGVKLSVIGGGARVQGVAIGTDLPGEGINYNFEYETVGVTNNTFNLRLQSPNHITFHTGGPQPGSPIERMAIRPSGNVSIGTPTQDLPFRLDVAGEAHASGFPTSSDARLKTNVKQLTNVLDKLDKIRGVSFQWNELYESLGRSTGRSEIGVIGQEVEAVFPELVTTWGDESYTAVDYGRLTGTLIEAVKELKAQNEALRSRIEALERA